jgi:hypothetical protein
MSLNSKQEIWVTLAREHYPTLTEDQILALSMTAATDWYSGVKSKLTQIFDQYIMLKTLKGLDNGKTN